MKHSQQENTSTDLQGNAYFSSSEGVSLVPPIYFPGDGDKMDKKKNENNENDDSESNWWQELLGEISGMANESILKLFKEDELKKMAKDIAKSLSNELSKLKKAGTPQEISKTSVKGEQQSFQQVLESEILKQVHSDKLSHLKNPLMETSNNPELLLSIGLLGLVGGYFSDAPLQYKSDKEGQSFDIDLGSTRDLDLKKLKASFEGTGENLKSKFSINIDKEEPEQKSVAGNVTVGNEESGRFNAQSKVFLDENDKLHMELSPSILLENFGLSLNGESKTQLLESSMFITIGGDNGHLKPKVSFGSNGLVWDFGGKLKNKKSSLSGNIHIGQEENNVSWNAETKKKKHGNTIEASTKGKYSMPASEEKQNHWSSSSEASISNKSTEFSGKVNMGEKAKPGENNSFYGNAEINVNHDLSKGMDKPSEEKKRQNAEREYDAQWEDQWNNKKKPDRSKQKLSREEMDEKHKVGIPESQARSGIKLTSNLKQDLSQKGTELTGGLQYYRQTKNKEIILNINVGGYLVMPGDPSSLETAPQAFNGSVNLLIKF